MLPPLSTQDASVQSSPADVAGALSVATRQGSVVRLALASGASAAEEMERAISELVRDHASDASKPLVAVAALPRPRHRSSRSPSSVVVDAERLLLLETNSAASLTASGNSTGSYTEADVANYNVFVWFAALWSLATLSIL